MSIFLNLILSKISIHYLQLFAAVTSVEIAPETSFDNCAETRVNAVIIKGEGVTCSLYLCEP